MLRSTVGRVCFERRHSRTCASRPAPAERGAVRAFRHRLPRPEAGPADPGLGRRGQPVGRSDLEAKRQHDLLRSGIAGTPQFVEQAEANDKRANAQRNLNQAQLDQQRAVVAGLDVQEKQIRAQIRAAEAQVTLASDNLRDTRIVAPADGLVGERQVRPGQFVNIGTQVIAVVSLPDVWVIANYKETQMTNVRIGQAARVDVDAFPGQVFKGHVESWSPGTGSTFALLPPDNATGNFTKVVQRVPVKIALDRGAALGALVRPGMSVEAKIDTGAKGGDVGEAASAAAASP